MDKSLKMYNLSKLTEEEINNHLIFILKIEFLVKNSLTKKAADPDCFAGEFYQTFEGK